MCCTQLSLQGSHRTGCHACHFGTETGLYLAQYKFIVDGEWKYAPDQPAMHDERGIINNVVEVQEYVPDHLDSLIGFEPPPSPPER